MAADSTGGTLYRIYRTRVGKPTTHDEVRGYWVFLVGLVLATVGFLLFLPSTSAVGASGLSLRELSIFLSAVGLSMLVAGPVIRLPLRSWANYAAYVGQSICFVAAVWFLLVFPAGWNVQTGSQPVIVLYVVGLATIVVGGGLAPLIAGVTKEDLEASERRGSELESELEAVRQERDELDSELERVRAETDAGEAARSGLQTTIDSLYASQARFELYEDNAGEWRWRLRHRNGQSIADSGEGYTRRHNAQKGMQSVRRNALGATTLLFESEEEVPSDEETFDPVEETESRANFEAYQDTAGEHRWRLRHENGNIIGDSAEGYASRRNARQSIDKIREYVGPADYLWIDPTGFEVHLDKAGEWRWRLVHRNGNVLADGGEGYTRRNDAKRAVERVRDRITDTEFEIYEDNAEEWRWRLRGGNQQIVADSGEGYDSREGAEQAVERMREYAPDADTYDLGRAGFEIYQDRSGEYRWRLRHRNGNVLMDCGEGYSNRSGARDGIESVKRNAANAEFEDTDS